MRASVTGSCSTGEFGMRAADREADPSRSEKYLSPAARLKFPIVTPERGEGCWLWDRHGTRYLDLHAMAGVANVGYGHPAVIEAIRGQAAKLVHCNPAYMVHELPLRLAERITEIVPGDFSKRVAFGLSGSDANDGAIKLARAATSRPIVIAFRGAYHGSTYGALSMSSVSPAMRRGFSPLLPCVEFAPFPDAYRGSAGGLNADEIGAACIMQLEELFRTIAPADDVAAVVVEPVQGDSGVLVPPPAFLNALRAITARHGILLVFDEVQTGLGRTGKMMAAEHSGVNADITVLGKALGGGMPISAIVARADLMDAWSAPGHVFSTSASPVAAAAALAVLDVIRDEGLAAVAADRGRDFRVQLECLQQDFEVVGDVRGIGLMLGVDFVVDRDSRMRDRLLTAKVVKGCYDRGCFVTSLAGSVLRIIPPLVITPQELDLATGIIREALTSALRGEITDDEVLEFTGW
jgi:4-aminobutyrate aminotransferase